jgi:transcriptional regulator with XRE-family HTH domain
MSWISAEQIKAARALLDWSQEDLAAAAGISTATIFNLEKGHLAFRSVSEVRQAFERSGIEFLPHDGLRRRAEDVTILQGKDSIERFLADLAWASKSGHMPIQGSFRTEDTLWRSLGFVDDQADEGALEPILSTLGTPQLLIAELTRPDLLLPYFAVRGIAKQQLGPIPTFIYGDRHALVLTEGLPYPKFIIFQSTSMAQSYRSHFELLWEQAMPLVAASAMKQVRA